MNKILRLIVLSNGVQVFAATLIIPIFALFIEDIGGGPELTGILFALSFVSMAIGNLFMIQIKDTTNLSALLYKVGLIIKFSAWVMIAIHQSIAILALAQVILGIATAIGAPAFDSLVSENLDKRKHISEWSQWNLAQNLSTAAASALSGFIVVYFGFSILFWIMAIITLVSFFVSLSISRK